MIHYFDRELNPITQSQWMEHFSNDSYQVVRRFDNGKVAVRLLWSGSVTSKEMTNLMPEYYPIFKIRVMNYNSAGVLVPDPVDDEKTFGDEQAASNYMNSFLERYTDCHWEGKNGYDVFVEPDNLLTPPTPPNPDAPSDKEIEGLTDEIGAW